MHLDVIHALPQVYQDMIAEQVDMAHFMLSKAQSQFATT